MPKSSFLIGIHAPSQTPRSTCLLGRLVVDPARAEVPSQNGLTQPGVETEE